MLEELSAILRFQKLAHVLLGRFWGLDTDCILELFLRKVVLSQNGSPHGVYPWARSGAYLRGGRPSIAYPLSMRFSFKSKLWFNMDDVFCDEVSPHLQSPNRSVVWKNIFGKLLQECHAEVEVNPLALPKLTIDAPQRQ